MIRHIVETEFGAFLAEQWRERGMNQLEFAARIRRQPAYICRVRLGYIKPPEESVLLVWADALDLNGDDIQRLLDLAALEHTPPRIRRKLLRLTMAMAG